VPNHSEDASLRVKLQARADELKALPRGWDSYDGVEIDPAAADKAVEVALALAPLFPSAPPQLVPGSDGTVQVEFHADGFDVEAWVQRA
jgi:hypothetical protein